MGRGKAKGSGFEREIAKQMSKWLSGSTKPYLFWRCHASGGLMTIDSCNTDFAGDIMGISTEAKKILDKVVIECKYGYKQISLDKFFKDNKNNLLRDFWDQSVQEAINTSRNPLLIYKKTGLPVIIMFRKDLIIKLNKELLNEEYINIKWKGYDELVLFNFETFLQVVKPEDIMNL